MRRRTTTAGVALSATVLLAVAAACGSTSSDAPPPQQTDSSSVATPDTSSDGPASATSVSAGGPITVVAPSTSASAPSETPATPASDPSDSETGMTTEPANTAANADTTPATSPTAPPSTASSAAAPGGVSGKVVVIDPGHNGANAAHPEIINKQVPAGFGAMKPCNTTGTATNDGYAEHAFNWGVAQELRDLLADKGITVVMTRDSDSGVGPCVNERAAIGNDAKADAVVSIHGDGAAAGVHGFFIMTASREPAGDEIAEETNGLAANIRDGLVSDGFTVSNTLGTNGLMTRSDLGGLNLSLRPTVMIELGNMRNADDAARMSSEAGQQEYAAGIAAGVLSYLAG